jgi:hypothetical protein
MQEPYREYLKNVSEMAPSLKTLELLLRLCTSGAYVMDLGTGFSSYVLRQYMTDLDINIMSIDDNAGWLGKTKDYCKSMGAPEQDDLGRDGWVQWNLLPNENVGKDMVDVVFMDLGTTRRRVYYYEELLEKYCNERTFILFDDMHKKILHHALHQELKSYTYLDIPVMDITKDKFGRYCKLITRLRRK